jgi:all-trans-8'-apo-beta-carotenal 15,15'-oxygenase
MDRRALLKALPVGAVAAAFASAANAKDEVLESARVWESLVLGARDDYPETLGRFDRALPAGLEGALFRNGPGRMHRGSTTMQHWFDGDGLVHAFRLQGNQLKHSAKAVLTKRFQAETRAGRYLWGGFGSRVPQARAIQRADDQNPANISLLHSGEELLALWEGGSPYRLDPKDLSTLGRKVFSQDTDGAPFGAHPKRDPRGAIWNIGYQAGSKKLIVYRLDQHATLKEAKLIDAPNADMVHDFAITERYLVLLLMPYLVDEPNAEKTLQERYRWHSDLPSQVMVLDKNTLEPIATIPFEATAFFHCGNAWEDGTLLRIELMRQGDFPALLKTFEDGPQGRAMHLPVGRDDGVVEVLVDLRGKRVIVERTAAIGQHDFPSYDSRYATQATDSLYCLGRSASLASQAFGFNQLVRISRRAQTVERFDYGSAFLAEEHLFVPTPRGKQGQGWVIGTSYHMSKRWTQFSVFNAQAIADGPIAQARLPYGLPPGLHGTWVPT